MFLATLFAKARIWKQPKCSSTDELLKILYIYVMEYYSTIKRNAFESVLMRWMNREPVIQCEVGQKEKDKYHILTHIYGTYKMVLVNLSAGQQWRCKHRGETCGHKRGRSGWDGLREYHWNTHITIDGQWKCVIRCGSSNPTFCDNLEGGGMGWEVEGRFKREGHTYTCGWFHAKLRQETAQCCKAMIRQLKINKF